MLIDLELLPFHPRLQTNNTHYVYYYLLFISFFRYAVEVVSKLFSFAGSLKGYILLHTRVRSLGAVRYVELGASRLTAITAVVRSPFPLAIDTNTTFSGIFDSLQHSQEGLEVPVSGNPSRWVCQSGNNRGFWAGETRANNLISLM